MGAPAAPCKKILGKNLKHNYFYQELWGKLVCVGGGHHLFLPRGGWGITDLENPLQPLCLHTKPSLPFSLPLSLTHTHITSTLALISSSLLLQIYLFHSLLAKSCLSSHFLFCLTSTFHNDSFSPPPPPHTHTLLPHFLSPAYCSELQYSPAFF